MWRDEEVQMFLTTLRYAGYGWLRPDGIQSQLKEIARQFQ
jgi:hypothetical protein